MHAHVTHFPGQETEYEFACLCPRYYLNGADAFRLKLLLPLSEDAAEDAAAQELAELHVTQASGIPVTCQ